MALICAVARALVGLLGFLGLELIVSNVDEMRDETRAARPSWLQPGDAGSGQDRDLEMHEQRRQQRDRARLLLTATGIAAAFAAVGGAGCFHVQLCAARRGEAADKKRPGARPGLERSRGRCRYTRIGIST